MNVKLASLLKVPHVDCNNHKLNLEINWMIKNDEAFSEIIEEVQQIMKLCVQQLKNRALLANLTPLKPVILHKIRWKGKNVRKVFDYCFYWNHNQQ